MPLQFSIHDIWDTFDFVAKVQGKTVKGPLWNIIAYKVDLQNGVV